MNPAARQNIGHAGPSNTPICNRGWPRTGFGIDSAGALEYLSLDRQPRRASAWKVPSQAHGDRDSLLGAHACTRSPQVGRPDCPSSWCGGPPGTLRSVTRDGSSREKLSAMRLVASNPDAIGDMIL